MPAYWLATSKKGGVKAVMIVRSEILILIALCALVTVVPRIFPMLFAHKIKLSAPMVAWLRILPSAILAALLFPELLVRENGDLLTNWATSPWLLAAGVVFVLCLVTRRMVVALLVGMLVFAFLK